MGSRVSLPWLEHWDTVVDQLWEEQKSSFSQEFGTISGVGVEIL